MGFLTRLLRNSSLNEEKCLGPAPIHVDAEPYVEKQQHRDKELRAQAMPLARQQPRARRPSGNGASAPFITGKRPPPPDLSCSSDGSDDSGDDDTLFALPPRGSGRADPRRAAIDFTESGASCSTHTNVGCVRLRGSGSGGDHSGSTLASTPSPHAAAAAAPGAACGGVPSRFSDVTLLHRGCNAYVYRARERCSGRMVVLKCYPASQRSKARQEALEREVALLTAATSACGVLQLEGTFEGPDGTWLVLEACTGGTLMEAIANGGGKLPEAVVVPHVALPLLRTLSQLHAMGVVHRHVKPEHLMLTPSGFKLGDFAAGACTLPPQGACVRATIVTAPAFAPLPAPGPAAPRQAGCDSRRSSREGRRSSREGRRSSKEVRRSFEAPCGVVEPPPSTPFQLRGSQRIDALNHRIGSIEYMAPEVLSKPTVAEVFHLVLATGMSEEELPVYDSKVDVWSAGVLLFEALTGYQPFLADSAADMAAAVHTKLRARTADGTPEFIARFTWLSAECRSFLVAALTPDPAARPSAAALLHHPWLASLAAAAPPGPACSAALAPPSAHCAGPDAAAACTAPAACAPILGGGDSLRRIHSEASFQSADLRPGFLTRGRTSRIGHIPIPAPLGPLPPH